VEWKECGLAVRDSCGTPREILHPAEAGFRMTVILGYISALTGRNRISEPVRRLHPKLP
jgi:hypothetical protein